MDPFTDSMDDVSRCLHRRVPGAQLPHISHSPLGEVITPYRWRDRNLLNG
jgi:hypothetical protein